VYKFASAINGGTGISSLGTTFGYANVIIQADGSNYYVGGMQMVSTFDAT
jgi:hypothetical protein